LRELEKRGADLLLEANLPLTYEGANLRRGRSILTPIRSFVAITGSESKIFDR
jgi:hypothetical protein